MFKAAFEGCFKADFKAVFKGCFSRRRFKAIVFFFNFKAVLIKGCF